MRSRVLLRSVMCCFKLGRLPFPRFSLIFFLFSLCFLSGPKPRQLSKKEMAEAAEAKRGQGNRTAKTGSRRTKYDAEAVAAHEKEKAKEKAAKKAAAAV